MRRIAALTIQLVGLLVLAACVRGAPHPTASAMPATAALTPVEPQSQPTEAPAAPMQASPTAQAPATAPVQVAETPGAPARWIALDEPAPAAVVSSPVHVRGRVGVTPFESTLRGRVYGAEGQVLGEAPILLSSEMGQPGDLNGLIPFAAEATTTGKVEIAEISPKDGSIMVRVSVSVQIAAGPLPGSVEVPAAGERVVLPLRILARAGRPGDAIEAVLRWQDGTELAHTFRTQGGEDGGGLLIDSLNWPGESEPPQPPSQPAVLELRDATGRLLARQDLVVLSADDPDTQAITVVYLLGEDPQPVTRRIPRTAKIGTAALEELLWGPPAPNLAGFGTALPTPGEVLAYFARGPNWGPRVRLRQLTIVDGVATADFSQEMEAYGGGSMRVTLIREQIEQTLKQFSTVREVVIAVEGETEAVLQP